MHKELREYNNFIQVCTAKNLRIQENSRQETENSDKFYELYAQDGDVKYECHINSSDNSGEVSNYISNYASTANLPLFPLESETGIPKSKPRPVEGTLSLGFMYFTTGDENSLDCGNHSTENAVLICTSSGELAHSILTLSPNYGYYIEGGGACIRHIHSGEIEVTLDVILAPNIPSEYGGSWRFIRNKKLCNNYPKYTLEVPPKYVKYYQANPYANQIQLEVEHGIDDQVCIEFWMNIYK